MNTGGKNQWVSETGSWELFAARLDANVDPESAVNYQSEPADLQTAQLLGGDPSSEW